MRSERGGRRLDRREDGQPRDGHAAALAPEAGADAIEYQGGGHFKGAHATAARDAVKKEALRRAGIGYVEVVAGDTPAELRQIIEKLVQKDAAYEFG